MVRRLDEKTISFDSSSDVSNLINSLYNMGDKESDFIANVVSS